MADKRPFEGITGRDLSAEAGVLSPTEARQEVPKDEEGETYATLVWRRFRRSKVGLLGAALVVLFYLVSFLFPEFFAPYSLEHGDPVYLSGPPQPLRFVDEAGFSLRPFVYGFERVVDPRTFRRTFALDTSTRHPVYFFARGEPYRLLGIIPTDIRLLGTAEGGTLYLMGTDRLGRDLFSRILYGGRLSLSIGLVGVFLSLLFGSILGTISGYYGGATDNIIMRSTEVIMSFPSLPLWMTLAAAVPPRWSPVLVYLGITVILSIISWGSLAREVRGKVLSLREEEYVLAARCLGAGPRRLIFRHLLPGCSSHLIVIASLAIPAMILAETALSFLGLGLRPPMTSWGVLLNEVQNVRSIAHAPWLIIPAIPVILVILAFNFLGDGLRDAADPYSRE